MISYAEALQKVQKEAMSRQLLFETIALEELIGRVTAQDLISSEAIPAFDNSSMDGFAILSSSSRGASPEQPFSFKVIGSIAAGDPFLSDLPPLNTQAPQKQRTTLEIMTGAPIPPGTDAVIKIEDAQVVRKHSDEALEILITKEARPQENIRFQGEDFQVGQIILPAHSQISPENLLALAALGKDRIQVFRRPKVVIISTGKELVHHSKAELSPGMIRNSTAPYLYAKLTETGNDPVLYHLIYDDPLEFEALLDRLIKEEVPDLIITTGAVSMGKHDFIKTVLEKLNAQVHFHRVAIKPGKPILFAKLVTKKSNYKPALLGIPGNPVSTAVGYRFFVEPYLRALKRQKPETPLIAKLGNNSYEKPLHLRCFYKAQLQLTPTGIEIYLLSGQESFKVSPFLHTQAWAVLPEGKEFFTKGDELEVYPLQPEKLLLSPSLYSQPHLHSKTYSHSRNECCR